MNAASVVARAAQIAAAACLAASAVALKAHRPLVFTALMCGLLAALVVLFFANLARRGDDPRPHPPGCACPHHRNH